MASGVLTVIVSPEVATACFGVCESVTWTLNVTLPRLVGVPLMVPSAPRLNPAGKLPEAKDHVYGPTPPVKANVVEYGTLITAAGRLAVVMTRGLAAIGGFVPPQESEKRSVRPLATRKEARFNTVMNDLLAQPTFTSVTT